MRLEGRKKLGFYPTPDSVVSKIKLFLKFPAGQTSFLDTCCGEGIALRELTEGENAVTYGIELDEARAEIAKENLHYVISGDCFHCKISNNVFSLAWQNPPYDTDGIERKELSFLRNAMKYLQPQGILVYIIPQRRIDEKIAKLLSLNFENIQVFQFPADEYQAFKQIVVLGSKKGSPEQDIPKLQELLNIPDRILPEIPDTPDWVYPIPETQPITLFKSGVIDMLELQESLQKSLLWSRLESTRKNGNGSHRPPLPLRTGHIALVLASGYLDGEVGDGDNLHIVKGRVYKETKKSTEVMEKEIVHKETDVIRISIKILEPNGRIKTLI